MSPESLSVKVVKEPGGRWVARVPNARESVASGDSPSGALRALADDLEHREAADQFVSLMASMREKAQRGGFQLSDEEIEAEIRAARAERRSRE